MPETTRPTYDSCSNVIDHEIAKHRNKWRLSAVTWMDYDDVSQKIRIHIFNKWNKWNPARPLEPWVNTIIKRQIINEVRNRWRSFARPCLQCPANQGGDLCSIYSKQCSDCPLFKKWEKTKKRAYNVKLPVSIQDEGSSEGLTILDQHESNESFIDYDQKKKELEVILKKKLKAIEWKLYSLLFIEGKEDDEVAKLMGYKTTENRKPGYKQIIVLKKSIMKKAADAVREIM